MDNNNKKECEMIIHALLNFQKYINQGNQLATLICELQQHNLELKEDEVWQIKDQNYEVTRSIFDINFILLQQNIEGKPDSIFLSELLPLAFTDFKCIQTKNEKKPHYSEP